MPTLTFKNSSVNYTVEGKGRNNVVLLHGFLESLEVWKDYSKQLSKSNRVVSIDLLGHGKSACVGYVHTMEEMAEAVHAVLKFLKIRRCIFVGHSLGGYVTLAFAEKYPEKTKGFCMFNSTAQPDTTQKKEDRRRAIEVVKHNAELFINFSIPNLFYDQEKYIDAIEKVLNIALKTPVQGIIAAIAGMMNRPNREVILKFTPAKVFYVIGKNDTVVPYQEAIKQSRLNKQGSYYLSPEGSHMCYIEDPHALKEVRRFINKC